MRRGGFAEDGDISGITPKPADVVAHPCQGRQHIAHRRIRLEQFLAGFVEGSPVGEAQRAQPVVDADHHGLPTSTASLVASYRLWLPEPRT